MDIYVLNKSYQTVGVIDVFESLVWVERYYGYGDFELYTEVDINLLNLLQEDYYLKIPSSDKTMIIEGIELKTNVETGNKLVVTGRSLESLIDRRIVWEQTQINTNIQQAVLTLVNDSMINPGGVTWPPWRKVNNMTWINNTDTLVTTPNVKGQYLQTNVYEAVIGLCKEVSVGFRIVLNNGTFEVGVYAGADRSYAQSTNPYVVFSPDFDNLLNSDYIHSKRYFKTLALILGHITDDGQFFRATKGISVPVNWSTLTGIDHRELGVDATHIPRYLTGTSTPISDSVFTEQIREVGAEELRRNSFVDQFDGQTETTNSYKYRTDYFLGDIVQIANEYRLTARSRITEVTISENLSGSYIYPTFEKI